MSLNKPKLLGNIMQFHFPEERIQDPVAALQRIFIGVHVPVEVFRVNMTALSARKLCSHLQDFNPGVLHSKTFLSQQVWLYIWEALTLRIPQGSTS